MKYLGTTAAGLLSSNVFSDDFLVTTRVNLTVCRRPYDLPWTWLAESEQQVLLSQLLWSQYYLICFYRISVSFVFPIITFRFNSAKKDNDFIYHESVPSLETLASVKGKYNVFFYFA